MTNTRKFLMLLSMSATMLLWSCGDDDNGDDDGPGTGPGENVEVSGILTEDQTWSSSSIYEISGQVVVSDGVTLTIEPGTIIKGAEGTGTSAAVLVVARGGSINAAGTAEAPIIFTTVNDDISYDNATSNLTREDKELWGGVIILGYAPISAESGDTESSIEGLPADEEYSKYGGDNASDNSGTFTYVSIRHGGAIISEGNEINGLTLGGVGTGTTINNIEVYSNKDDGIEFFGGTVDVENALVYFQGDDGIDIDQNYSGTVDNFVVLHGGTDTDEALEIDGPEGTATDGLFTLVNGTTSSQGGDDPGTPADLKSKAQGTISNVNFVYAEDNILKIRSSYNDDCSIKTDALENLFNDILVIEGSAFGGTSPYSNTDGCDVTVEERRMANEKAVPTTATGADLSVFAGWTKTDQNGELVLGESGGETITKSGELSADETWTAGNTYVLDGRVIVGDGVTLTIEPGTLVKGEEGQGTSASVLVVARGGKLMAEGTADAPIVFTSVLDDIQPGSIVGTLDVEDKELWGGIIMLGKAPISAEDGDTESSIEGLPADEEYSKYGGDVADDNSGSLKYVSVRHSGIPISEGNEINGLTLGGVGSGTTLENIEIYATKDDGIEFFGGSVSVTNIIISYQGDDGVDIDQNYSGTVDNFIVIHGGFDTDEALEIDGPEGTATDGLFTLKNGLCMTDGGEDPGTPADLKSKAQGTIENVVFTYDADNVLKVRSSYEDGCAIKTDALKNIIDDVLVITGSSADGISAYSNTDGCDVAASEIADAEAKVELGASATGADKSVFDGWTAAAATELLMQ